MSNERNLISDQVITNRAPVRNQDNKHAKKAGDGTMSFMVWSITGTALAACSGPIFGDGTSIGGGGGRSGGSGVFTISESSSGPTSIAAQLGSVPADGGVYISPDVVHRPQPQTGPEGADIQTGPGDADIQDATIMFRRGALDGTDDIPLSDATADDRGVPTEDIPTGFLGDRGMDESGETFYYVSADRLERLFLSFDDTYQVDADFDINLHVYDSANEMFAIDETTARTVPVRFEAVDDPATGIALVGRAQTVTSIPEANGIARTKIADLMIDDIDETPLNTLEIVVTDDSLARADADRIVALFELGSTPDGTAIYLRAGVNLDHETFTVLPIRVQSVADSTIGVNISVAVTDVNDVAPMITSGATGGALVEGTEIPADTQVVYAAAGDFDVTPIVWSLEPNTGDEGLFNINVTTGAVTFAATTTPDNATKATYTFTVVATSGSLTPARQSVTIDVTDIPSEDVAPVADLAVSSEAVRAFVIINGVEFRVNADSNASPRSDYEILFRAVSANSVITPNTAPGLIGVNITTAGNNDKFSQVNIARLFNGANLNLYDVAAIIREADESATERTITNWQSAETDFIYDFITASTALDFTVTEDDEADSTARGFLEVTGGTGTYTYTGGTTTVIGTGTNAVTYQIFDGMYGQLIVDGDGNWTYVLDNTNPLTQALDTGENGTDRFTVTVRETGGAMRTEEAMIEITVNGADNLVVTNEGEDAVFSGAEGAEGLLANNFDVAGAMANDGMDGNPIITDERLWDARVLTTPAATQEVAFTPNTALFGEHGQLLVTTTAMGTLGDPTDPDVAQVELRLNTNGLAGSELSISVQSFADHLIVVNIAQDDTVTTWDDIVELINTHDVIGTIVEATLTDRGFGDDVITSDDDASRLATHDELDFGPLHITAREAGDLTDAITIGFATAGGTPGVAVSDEAIVITIPTGRATFWQQIFNALYDDLDVMRLIDVEITGDLTERVSDAQLAAFPETTTLDGGADQTPSINAGLPLTGGEGISPILTRPDTGHMGANRLGLTAVEGGDGDHSIDDAIQTIMVTLTLGGAGGTGAVIADPDTTTTPGTTIIAITAETGTTWGQIAEAINEDSTDRFDDIVTAQILFGSTTAAVAGSVTLTGGAGTPDQYTFADNGGTDQLIFSSRIAGNNEADGVPEIGVVLAIGSTLGVVVTGNAGDEQRTITITAPAGTAWSAIRDAVNGDTDAGGLVSVVGAAGADLTTAIATADATSTTLMLDGGTNAQDEVIAIPSGADDVIEDSRQVAKGLFIGELSDGGSVNFEVIYDEADPSQNEDHEQVFVVIADTSGNLNQLYFIGDNTGSHNSDDNPNTPDYVLTVRGYDANGVFIQEYEYAVNVDTPTALSQAPAQQQPQQGVEIYSDDMDEGPSDDIPPQNPDLI